MSNGTGTHGSNPSHRAESTFFRKGPGRIVQVIKFPGKESFVINHKKGDSGYDLLDRMLP